MVYARLLVRHRPPRLRIKRQPDPSNAWGKESEDRFFAICNTAGIQTRRANAEEDISKIDAFVLFEDEAEMPLQIKRSLNGKKKHQRLIDFKHIPCLVVSPNDSDEKILADLQAIIAQWRSQRD